MSRLANVAVFLVAFAVMGFLLAQYLAARGCKSTVDDGVSLYAR